MSQHALAVGLAAGTVVTTFVLVLISYICRKRRRLKVLETEEVVPLPRTGVYGIGVCGYIKLLPTKILGSPKAKDLFLEKSPSVARCITTQTCCETS